MDLYTIGYEGAAVGDLIATLRSAGVELVLDVRELPQSRRPGFSKNVLAAGLAEAGISYRHIRQLGDPKHGRDAARAGRMDEFRQIFGAHMELPTSQSAVKEAADLSTQKTTALLCYERNPKDCHRSIVAQAVVRITEAAIRHLGVQPGGKRNYEQPGTVATWHA